MLKISIIGAGKVGSTTAWYVLQRELGEVTLVDISKGVPEGIALDINEASPLQRFDTRITGTDDFSQIKNSDIVVITAGLPRQPGMDRLDLLKKNYEIISSISANVKKFAPNSIVIVVTNPLDVMVYAALKKTGFKKQKLFGMSGMLDSSRLRYFIAKELGVSVKVVSAMVLGSHGDNMLPLLRYTTVSGISVTELLPKEKLDKIAEHTKKAGGEIVSYLKTGSAYHAPAAAITEMIESIAKDQKQVMPVCAYLQGEYNLKNLTAGVPCVLGRNGIEKIIELKLTNEELKKLHASAKETEEAIKELKLD